MNHADMFQDVEAHLLSAETLDELELAADHPSWVLGARRRVPAGLPWAHTPAISLPPMLRSDVSAPLHGSPSRVPGSAAQLSLPALADWDDTAAQSMLRKLQRERAHLLSVAAVASKTASVTVAPSCAAEEDVVLPPRRIPRKRPNSRAAASGVQPKLAFTMVFGTRSGGFSLRCGPGTEALAGGGDKGTAMRLRLAASCWLTAHAACATPRAKRARVIAAPQSPPNMPRPPVVAGSNSASKAQATRALFSAGACTPVTVTDVPSDAASSRTVSVASTPQGVGKRGRAHAALPVVNAPPPQLPPLPASLGRAATSPLAVARVLGGRPSHEEPPAALPAAEPLATALRTRRSLRSRAPEGTLASAVPSAVPSAALPLAAASIPTPERSGRRSGLRSASRPAADSEARAPAPPSAATPAVPAPSTDARSGPLVASVFLTAADAPAHGGLQALRAINESVARRAAACDDASSAGSSSGVQAATSVALTSSCQLSVGRTVATRGERLRFGAAAEQSLTSGDRCAGRGMVQVGAFQQRRSDPRCSDERSD